MLKRSRMSVAVWAAFSAGVIGVPAVHAQAQQQLERVEITGSSLRRVDAETALPVTIIKTEDLIKQGVTTAEQAVQRIAANQSNFGVSQAIGGTTGAKAEADLRGLSAASGTNANKTLVLLNGRRVANHAFDAAAADLNAIPLSAIDRIEVLRDGASAIYGTDAIGGVINFVLRRDYQGVEVAYENQAPQGSGADVQRANLTAGFGSLSKQRFNAMLVVDWRRQENLQANERKFSETGIIGGDVVSGTSGSSFPGDVGGFEPSLPGCAPPNSIPNPAGTACRYDFTREIDIIPTNEQLTTLVKLSGAITPDHIVALEYLRAENKATAQVAAAPTSMTIPTTSPFYPAGALGVDSDPVAPGIQPPTVVNWRMVPAGKRTSGDDTTTERTLLEYTGGVGGFDMRASLGEAKNKSDASVKKGYVNDSLIQDGITAGIINPFGPQPQAGTDAIEAAQVRAVTLTGENKVSFADFRVTKDLMQMANGPLAAALGVEYRDEKSSFVATDITAQLGSLGIDPDSDTSGSRDVTALFAEFNIPILKNLEMTLAGRYDNYSDFGSTFNPKIGVRYQPTQTILLRGSFNTGFRAPTLYEIYQPTSLTFTTDNYDDPLLCPGGVAVPGASAGVVCGQQTLQRNAGPVGIGKPASSLNPEESESFSIGFVFEPMPSVTFGLDYWSIKVEQQISGLPEQAVFGDATKYASRFVRCSQLPAGPGPGIDRTDIDVCLNTAFDPIAYIDTPIENLGELHTSGIDVSASWRSGATPYGVWGVSLDGTYVDEYKYQREQGGQYFYAAGKYSDNAPVFRWQHVATVSFGAGPWGALLANRYKSGYTDQGGATDVKPYSVYDATLTYTGVKNLTLAGGILNMFDEDPPVTVQSTTFQRGYDPRFTDPRGRTYMFRVGYRFL